MNKLWIKLLRAYDGHETGALLEVDETIGRALIAAKVADESIEAKPALDAVQDAGLRTALDGLRTEMRSMVEGLSSVVKDAKPNLGRIEPGESEDDKRFNGGDGFRSIGHFGRTVFRGAHPSSPEPDAAKKLTEWRSLAGRVTRGVASGTSETVDGDGGLLVPTTISTSVWDKSREYENLGARLDLMPIGGSAMSRPRLNENSRANGSRHGGVQGYWEGEADQYVKSKPSWANVDLKLKKLTILVFATNEVLEDSGGALESELNRLAPMELAFKVSDGVVNGTGAGQLLGIMATANKSRITVPAVGGQGAGTITGQNISDMWKRMYAPCRRNSFWLMNQDAEGQLDGLKFATGSASGQLVYQPPSGLAGDLPYTIKGRPVLTVEQCATLGTEGDILLVDFTQYAGIRKASGVTQSMSIHLRFDYDETVFKFSLRMDAQPYWDGPLTPFKGTNTQSPFLSLNSTRT